LYSIITKIKQKLLCKFSFPKILQNPKVLLAAVHCHGNHRPAIDVMKLLLLPLPLALEIPVVVVGTNFTRDANLVASYARDSSAFAKPVHRLSPQHWMMPVLSQIISSIDNLPSIDNQEEWI
jgi:hypothetical protein